MTDNRELIDSLEKVASQLEAEAEVAVEKNASTDGSIYANFLVGMAAAIEE